MPLQLQPVDPDADFAELIECMWEAFETPYQKWFRITCPIHGTGPSAREDSLAECTARHLASYQGASGGQWVKVVNDDGRIVGGAWWKIFRDNPYAAQDGAPRASVTWYPEGPQRDYVTAALRAVNAPKRKMATRPHVNLNILFTHPEHRRQGVADLLLSWGIGKADEMGVEAWVTASDFGRHAYEKHGFICVDSCYACPTTDTPSDEWNMIKDQLTPMPVSTMWRPPGGKYEPGVTVKPWE